MGIDFSSSRSIGIFKKGIFDLIRPRPKPLYGLHDPSGVKCIFQLRVGLSMLKFHKKRHNFADITDDLCDCMTSREDIFHLLLTCPLYVNPRAVLFNSVSNILIMNNLEHLVESVDIYLYGHSSLHSAENKDIILSTMRFIHESNRFH